MLEPGRPIEHDLVGGQQQGYRIKLNAGQFLRVIVEQEGIDVVVRVSGPDGRQIMEVDFESRPRGQESVSLVAGVTGEYRLMVQPRYRGVPAGGYQIRVEELRLATENDRALELARNLAEDCLTKLRAGKYAEALSLIEQARSIRERVLGPDHPEVASAVRRQAVLYNIKGDYPKAEALFQRVLMILERSVGPSHPSVAAALNNLGLIYTERGDYVRAEPLLQRAIAMLEAELTPEHLSVANFLDSLASLYRDRGDYVKAEPLFQRVLAIREKALGPAHLDVAAVVNNLALLYAESGDYVKAEPLFQRALAIREKALRTGHPFIADSLDSLANLYLSRGKIAEAEPLFRRALASRKKELGPENQDVAQSLNNLAKLYWYKGDYPGAEMLYRQALDSRERVLGPQHPRVAETLNALARLYVAKGNIAPAIALQSRANVISEYSLGLNLSVGSERQKLAFLALSSKETDFTLSLHSRIAPQDPEALSLAFTTLLRRKGRGLDAMTNTIAALRRQATPEDQVLLDRLEQSRSHLAALTLNGPGNTKPEIYRAQLKPLEAEVEKLESQLSSRRAGFRVQVQPVTLAAVRAALPADSALVEFAVYTPREPRTERPQPPRYIVYLLTPQGRMGWADLGETAPIDRAVERWRQALRDPNRTDIKQLARVVNEQVLQPVLLRLGEMPEAARHLLIAPDGLLNLIPFAALVDEQNRYLIERYTITYLTSGRDLLRFQTSEPSRNAPLIMANPFFGRVAVSGQAGNQGRAETDSAELFFQALPNTEHEAMAINAVLPEASVLLRDRATEAALKQAQAPSLLHIATHGFFLSDQDETPVETRGLFSHNLAGLSGRGIGKWAAKIENPLLRSGLALAGVNEHWSRDDDGVLTAMEAASLNLSGTRLVVLSACDTGLGDVRNGEGVYGLRRALVLAGSETQVMSLWPVSDHETRSLMVGYYRRLLKGEGRGEALRQIQLRMLKSAEHPYYWASFIQAGEWANLEGRR